MRLMANVLHWMRSIRRNIERNIDCNIDCRLQPADSDAYLREPAANRSVWLILLSKRCKQVGRAPSCPAIHEFMNSPFSEQLEPVIGGRPQADHNPDNFTSNESVLLSFLAKSIKISVYDDLAVISLLKNETEFLENCFQFYLFHV